MGGMEFQAKITVWQRQCVLKQDMWGEEWTVRYSWSPGTHVGCGGYWPWSWLGLRRERPHMSDSENWTFSVSNWKASEAWGWDAMRCRPYSHPPRVSCQLSRQSWSWEPNHILLAFHTVTNTVLYIERLLSNHWISTVLFSPAVEFS